MRTFGRMSFHLLPQLILIGTLTAQTTAIDLQQYETDSISSDRCRSGHQPGRAAAREVLLTAPAQAGETVVLTGPHAWTGVTLVGYNPYGNKKSFYPTPLTYADGGRIVVHSRGSDARKGAEEKTVFVRFDLAKLPRGAKVASAKLVFPVQRSAGKKNAVQVFDVLAAWTDKLDWKTTDGETAWQVEGCHGEKDKKQIASFDVPEGQYDAKAPTELSCDVTDLVRKWLADPTANHGMKLEMTGGYVVFAMKGFRLEVTLE